MSSRLIVKNIPKNIDEQKVQSHFEKFGEITDVKIMFKNKQNRRFCFIGYKTDKSAKEAQKYFNNTYLQASKIQVEFAKTKDDETLVDRNNYKSKKQQQIELQKQKKQKTQESNQKTDKSDKFKEFLELMKTGSSKNMSWNDVLYEKEEKKKKKQQKKEEEKTENQLEKIEQQLEEQQNDKKNKQKEGEQENNKENQEGEVEKKEIDERRLYIVNLPYSIKEDEARLLFEKYGKVTELKLPYDKNTLKAKGFCFLSYELPEEALRCFSELDNKVIFGRILHVRPAFKQPQKEEDQVEDKDDDIRAKEEQDAKEAANTESSSYKKLKKVEMRKKLDDQTNWNTLFLNPNSILESISQQYNIRKSEILSSDTSEMAVRTAHAETQIIKETKEWMEGQGMSLDFVDTDRKSCKRSDTIILVKNIHYSVNDDKLKDIFSHYGVVDRVLLSPNRSLGIVEFISSDDAKNAFKNLSYHIIKHSPLYLEWAPFDLIETEKREIQQQEQEQEENEENLTKILYVKNLNFETSDSALQNHFEQYNLGDIKSVKIVRKKDGLSSGYGFIEFRDQEGVKNALKKVQNSKLEGHVLQLSVSRQKQKIEPKSKRKQIQQYQEQSKIIVRNLAFEATQKEIRDLFKHYGEVKSVRLPKKINGQHRGFAFVEFVSTEEARNAVSSLGSTHLYGRKLVIEYARQGEE